jgi:hypothetical protein
VNKHAFCVNIIDEVNAYLIEIQCCPAEKPKQCQQNNSNLKATASAADPLGQLIQGTMSYVSVH